jgi:hypothetical protein
MEDGSQRSILQFTFCPQPSDGTSRQGSGFDAVLGEQRDEGVLVEQVRAER